VTRFSSQFFVAPLRRIGVVIPRVGCGVDHPPVSILQEEGAPNGLRIYDFLEVDWELYERSRLVQRYELGEWIDCREHEKRRY
jgi:hypothetical protein